MFNDCAANHTGLCHQVSIQSWSNDNTVELAAIIRDLMLDVHFILLEGLEGFNYLRVYG